MEEYKEILNDVINVVELTKENDERKDIISAAKQALAISKLSESNNSANSPATKYEEISVKIAELKSGLKEKIEYFKGKYHDSEAGLNHFGVAAENYEIKEEEKSDNGGATIGEHAMEKDLLEMQSLVNTSKELTEIIRDANKGNNFSILSRIESTKTKSSCIETEEMVQMLKCACGVIEEFM